MAAPANGRSNGHAKTGIRSRPGGLGIAPRRTPWTAWLYLLPLVTVLPWLLSKLHYSLPSALPPTDASGRAQPSEEVVLGHIKALEDIGYRTVGTWEAYNGEQYVLSEVRKLEERCNAGGVLHCEVWLQKGSGCHQFSILDHDVLKMYEGISNVIMRISAPSGQRAEKDAVLLGSHIDSSIPAPGAADDGIGVGVMLDIARVIIDRNEPFDASVLFVWNGAEETLQDGSHMYSVHHETAKDVRAVINLEAAGTTGGALLFQATSAEMINAFSHAPHPRGTVAASDVFASGIMMSDTDFGQFEQYMNVSGLDFALVGHSYFYHTRGDVLKHITPGSAQHFTSNVFAIVQHLLSPGTPLLSPEPWHKPDIVYLSLYDRIYFSWTMATANKVYGAITALVFILAAANCLSSPRAFWISIAGNIGGFLLGIVGANVLAAVLHITGFRQAWFRHEHLSCLFYAPPAFATAFAFQNYLSRRLTPPERLKLEKAYIYSHLVTACLYMALLQAFQIRSAYFFAAITSVLLVVVVLREISSGPTKSLVLGYAPGLVGAVFLLVEAVTTINDIFVPLTGRMGKAAPAEFIIAVISSSTGMIFMPLAFPLFHRLSRPAQRRTIYTLLGLTAVVVAYFAGPAWPKYDPMHPKRVAVQYTFNHTSGDTTLHVCTMDRGDELSVPEKLHSKYGSDASPLQPTILTPYETDWDVIYPVSSFLDTWRFDLAPEMTQRVDFEWPKMGWEVTEKPHGQGRTLSFKLNFTELVFPTVAFEADIESWSFDVPPPSGKKRHHFKIAASVDTPVVDMELTVRDGGKIKFDWSAIDGKQMVPGTAVQRGPERPGSQLLLEADAWMEREWAGALDILMFATVTGAVEV